MKKIFPLLSVFALSFLSVSSYAYTSQDKSTLDMPLSKDWRVTKTEQQGDYATITVYSKKTNENQTAELFQTTLKKTFDDAAAAKNVKNLQTDSLKLMKQQNCKPEMMRALPKARTFTHEWGMFWECEHIKTSGFMLFLIGDNNTMYNFTYRVDGVYPLTKTNRDDMINLLKSTQICYQNNKCESLL